MRKVIVTAAILLNLLISFSQTEVQGFPFGFYAGIKTEYFTLGGDFNGEDYFFTDDATIFVPKIEPGFAFGFQAGLIFQEGSLDFGYQLSKNAYSHANDSSGSALIHNLKLIGFTFYLNHAEKLKPYITSDISMAWMNIKNGAFGVDSYHGQTGKSYFSGIVLGLGTGIEWNVASNFSFRIEVLPELFKLGNVKGITKEYWDVKKFICFKMNLAAGIYYDLF